LRFISFGSEEKGLRGSNAYIKRHLQELQEENAHLINIDSVRLPDEVSIITGEAMSFVKFNENLIAKTAAAFASKNLPYKTGAIPMGATDAIPFQKNGIPSLSIIGISMKSLDPTYHTRLDVIENINQQALDNVKSALVALIQKWDA
jgi:Zn-dependent M28 family amino/carboxypeptidase